jgi:hypothetical protein
LQCSRVRLRSIVSDYDVRADREVEAIAPRIRARGFARRDEFLVLCEWKSKRPRKRYRENDAKLVEEITRIALNRATRD